MDVGGHCPKQVTDPEVARSSRAGRAIDSRVPSVTSSIPEDAVVHAREADKPKTRYVMGTGAGQRKLLRRLPDRLRDRLVLKALGVS